MAFSLPHLLWQAASRDADAVALRVDGVSITYASLAERANAIAAVLGERGLRQGERVAVAMKRSFDSLAAVFGVMQAGGAYVPLSLSAPPTHNEAILQDCGVRLGIVGEESAASLPTLELLQWKDVPVKAPPYDRRVIETDLCVIFYTSGSTGRPKGVAHAHRSMLSNVEWALAKYELQHDDRFAHVTSPHFDLSWFEMYASIASCGTLVIVPEEAILYAHTLASLLEREKLTIWCSVPHVLVSLVERGDLASRDLHTLRHVMFAAERFPTKRLVDLMRLIPQARYTNMYGTTETHIATYFDIPPDFSDRNANLPIGRGCEHVKAVALKSDGTVAKRGETGELVIRGPSLMEAYWDLPERSAAALTPLALGEEVVSKWYHTGDLVYEDAAGNFQIIGRADRRVKVRGNLVDLDEVERVLLMFEGVRESAAYVADAEQSTAHVDAAVVLDGAVRVHPAELRLHVSKLLPIYAVPEQVAILETMPRTTSGKLSRSATKAGLDAQQGSGCGSATVDGAMKAIRAYVSRTFLDSASDRSDEPLLGGELLDSLGVTRLVGFIEETIGKPVPNEEFVASNFVTYLSIEKLVSRLLQLPRDSCVR